MSVSTVRPHRVLFYVQHLLGIGHLARASRIARALSNQEFDVTMVTGGLPVEGFPGDGLSHVALPPIAAGEKGFSEVVDADGRPLDEAFKAARRDKLVETYRTIRPDVLIIEAFPFGRRQVRFELLPLLEEIHSHPERPLVLSSVRDILQAHGKPGRDEETVQTVKTYFDRVLVHGDPTFANLGDSFPASREIEDRIVYTGLVAAPPPRASTDRFDIVVSAGGGAVGAGLLRSAASASRMMDPSLTWCLIAGPNLPEADYLTLGASLPQNAQIVRFRTDFPGLLKSARVSVSQAGYNTVCDVLRAGCGSVLIPFAAGGETEQGERARRLRQLGRASILTEDRLRPEDLADAIHAELDRGNVRAVDLDLDGANHTAAIIARLLEQR